MFQNTDKHRMDRKMRQIFAPLLVLLLAACGSTESRIIGKWRGIDNGQKVEMEFSPDGKIVTKGIITVSGKYAFPFEDKNKVEFSEFLGLKTKVVFDVKVENDKLYMTGPYSSLVYERVRE
jgi:uncharacterized lipoprotein YehR (DUF1307 family)